MASRYDPRNMTVGDFTRIFNDRSTAAEKELGFFRDKDENRQNSPIHATASLGDAKPTNSAA